MYIPHHLPHIIVVTWVGFKIDKDNYKNIEGIEWLNRGFSWDALNSKKVSEISLSISMREKEKSKKDSIQVIF